MAGSKCTIELTSGQTMGGDMELTTETYQGSFIKRGEVSYISYTRKSEDGQVSALLTLEPKFMTISQKGSLNTSLKFLPKEVTDNKYGTPQGVLNLQIFTKKYSVYQLKDGIKIELNYDLVTGHDPIRTQMSIVIKFIDE